MKKILKIVSIFVFVLSLVSFTNDTTIPTVNDWTILGQRSVNMRADHDEIRVTAAKETFNKVRFKITKAPIYVKNVKIIFGNGSAENHIVNKAFRKGTLTQAINLRGRNRVIKKIVLNYKTVNTGKGKAHVIAFGKH